MESKGPQVFFVAHMLFLLEADLARQLAAGSTRILVDEFTSVLDRTLAAALCVSVESYVPWEGKGGEFVAGNVLDRKCFRVVFFWRSQCVEGKLLCIWCFRICLLRSKVYLGSLCIGSVVWRLLNRPDFEVFGRFPVLSLISSKKMFRFAEWICWWEGLTADSFGFKF